MKQIISDYKTEKKKSNKKLLIPLFAVLLIGSVFAVGYIVHSITINVDVGEPFDLIEYGVLGLGSSYDPTIHGDCDGATYTTYTNNQEVEMGYMDAGESKKVCVRITNNADADITYTITPTVTAGGPVCLDAFNGLYPITGPALKATTTIDGETVTVSQGADVVDDCKIRIDVARG